MENDRGGGEGGSGVHESMHNHDKCEVAKEEEEEEVDSSSGNYVENNNGGKAGISIAERRAAKCGFNASNIKATQFRISSSSVSDIGGGPPLCFTIPSGISPSALLDSPIMLPNAQAQLSPTTGTFQISPPIRGTSDLKLKSKNGGNKEDSVSVMCQEFQHSESNNFLVENKPPLEDIECPNSLHEIAKRGCNVEDAAIESCPVIGNNNNKFSEAECSNMVLKYTRNGMSSSYHNTINEESSKGRTPHPNQDKYQKGTYCPKEVTKYSEDGFYWRKYGQKHVKGSEYPRSYYKCTNTNCPVRKKVERSHDGQITEIVYKGSHNHPEPQPVKRLGEILSSEIMNEGSGSAGSWWYDADTISSTSFATHFSEPMSTSTNTFEPTLFSSQDGNVQNEESPESISLNDEDDEYRESETKKRKRESFSSETAIPRSSTREPRIVVQVESDIDILDDGYRWRKYGQKVVKGNPNPRSYYKCTSPGCPVRKHVERAADDIKSVITTYEGKHNHEVPSSKTGTATSDIANLSTSVSPIPLKPKAGKQGQDLPLYLERKPILNYNELMMRSNLGTDHLSFGTPSSVNPLSFPSFHSLPYGMNHTTTTTTTTTHPSSLVYPMLPEYMLRLPPQINQIPPASTPFTTAGNGNGALNFINNFNNIAGVVKPKEEHGDDTDTELYDSCLSIPPDHGN